MYIYMYIILYYIILYCIILYIYIMYTYIHTYIHITPYKMLNFLNSS